jgi:hypothetical protein
MPVCQRCIKRTPTDQQHDCRESDRTERREGKRYNRYSGPSARPDDSKDPTPQAIVDVSAHNQIAGECCPRDVFCPDQMREYDGKEDGEDALDFVDHPGAGCDKGFRLHRQLGSCSRDRFTATMHELRLFVLRKRGAPSSSTMGSCEHYSRGLLSIVRAEFAKLLKDVVDLGAVFFGKGRLRGSRRSNIVPLQPKAALDASCQIVLRKDLVDAP